MADAGLILACAGCCCGHPDKGGARIPKPAWHRAFDGAGLGGRVRLAFTECLGPCSEANVVFVYLDGRPLWFRRINATPQFSALLAYTRAALGARDTALPGPLAARSFSWTGGGVGPPP